MRTYIQIQQDKERVETITKEYFDAIQNNGLYSFGIGLIGISYVLGLTAALWYENILVF